MKRPQRPPQYHDIEIEVEGVKYRGQYVIEKQIITVTGVGQTTSTQVSAADNNVLAKVILGEHVVKSKRKA